MKVLYLARHGVAKDVGEDGIQTDVDRPLSTIGIDRTRLAGKGLNRIMEYYPDVVLTSPLTRATETADIFADELKGSRQVVSTQMLEPGVPPLEILAWLDQLDWTCMLLVGHMPDMAMMAGTCLSTEELDISFKKASVCCIRFYSQILPGEGELEWHLQPRLLRALAK